MSDAQNTPAAARDPLDMAVKRQLHEKADLLNRAEERQGRLALLCGARKKRGPGFCRNYAGMGTEHVGWGRCKFCGGMSTGPKTPEGKAASAQNGRKSGFYSQALSYEEREAYEEQLEAESLGLQHEIYLVKAKIVTYLTAWKRKWDRYYKAKLAEKKVKYVCTSEGCGAFVVRGTTESDPGYCQRCGSRGMAIAEEWEANHTPEEAEAYADRMTKVYFSEGEKGGRSYYHAGSLEDRTLDRALNTLSRLVEKHARLKAESGDDLLSQINKELQLASQGKVSISWGGKPQTREGGPADGPG